MGVSSSLVGEIEQILSSVSPVVDCMGELLTGPWWNVELTVEQVLIPEWIASIEDMLKSDSTSSVTEVVKYSTSTVWKVVSGGDDRYHDLGLLNL